GAPWPEGKIVPAVVIKKEEFDLAKRRRQHWAWQPIHVPALPPVENQIWCEQPLDRFLLARLEAQRLRPAPRADKRTLIRRVYFDLIGLPPRPDAVNEFV